MERKRLLDLAASAAGLLALAPLILAIAAAIKADDGGPVFFRQERVGRGGKPFRIWKFRTMVVDAERRGRSLTVGADPRITRVGDVLRRYKLDELPQLWNVLVGEMGLVGPRPEVPRYVALYDEAQRAILALRPGITDMASIKYRHEAEVLSRSPDPERTYVEEIMPDKIRINLASADDSVRTSLKVILLTLVAIVRPTEAQRPWRASGGGQTP